MSKILRKYTRVLEDGSTVDEIQEIEYPDREFKRNCIIAAVITLLASCGIVIGILRSRT